MCERQFETSKDMKSHMQEHSYKRANFKCEECDFIGQNKSTMQVHTGKYHSENYECRLCDFEANNLETLETHLVTCEIHHCYACEIKAKQLKDIKEHVKIEHDNNVGIEMMKIL